MLEEFPIRNQGVMQAFVFNTRRDKFSDPRVRRAFNYAFDFEEMNKQIFFGQYKRIASYFDGTELASATGGLLARREPSCDDQLGTAAGPGARSSNGARQVPPEVFTTPYTQSGRRHARGRAQQSARGVRLLEGCRLGDPRRPAGQRSRPTSR